MNATPTPQPGPSGDTGNVRFVDKNATLTAFLFRGSLPEANGSFDYKDLQDAIVDAGRLAGTAIPPDFYLLDVSLLQPEDRNDFNRTVIEIEFFRNNPGLGQIVSWETGGTQLDPDQKEIGPCRDYLAGNLGTWLGDPLIDRVNTLHGWLLDPSPVNPTTKPLVIYVHCLGGCDRTGEVIGAYYLRWLGMSWEIMNDTNNAFCGRYFGCNNYRATRWYCLWLNETQGYSLSCTAQPCT